MLASIPLLLAASIAYSEASGPESRISGLEATGGGIILFALVIAPAYIAIVFPLRATVLKRRGLFTSYAFRRGQTSLLTITCFVLSLIAVIALGGASLDGLAMAASLTVITTFLSAVICFPSAFVWLKLANVTPNKSLERSRDG